MDTAKAPGRSNKPSGNAAGLPALLTVSQVAEATGFSTKTIRRRLSEGALRGVRVGPRAIRIHRDSVLGMLIPLGA